MKKTIRYSITLTLTLALTLLPALLWASNDHGTGGSQPIGFDYFWQMMRQYWPF